MHTLVSRSLLTRAFGAHSRALPSAYPYLEHVTKTHTRQVTTMGSNDRYWQRIPVWKDLEEKDFLNYEWQMKNSINKYWKLAKFMNQVLPTQIPAAKRTDLHVDSINTRDDFLKDLAEGMSIAPMAVRLTPHILSVIDWSSPLDDPIIRQFVPLKSRMVPDHPELTLDSLHEEGDSPVRGLVHRYPDKVLFLATSICPVYCRFCTRSYAVGEPVETVTKRGPKAIMSRWEPMFGYIESHEEVQDVVVSGGDSYTLEPKDIKVIGERLLHMPNIKRIRFATKGLAVCPVRIIDPGDAWTKAFVEVSDLGRTLGKQVAMHTHFNHPNEITWATRQAALSLFQRGVVVRNQTVLLRGVNDDKATMASLIRQLADMNITPYYVYQSDMVKGVEDLRTPLSTILELEKHIRGTIAGFMMPSFIVDLPGGGGKRLASSYETYDAETGVSTWRAPGVAKERVFTYWDPNKQASRQIGQAAAAEH